MAETDLALEDAIDWSLYDKIYYPAGVRHADHVLIRMIIDDILVKLLRDVKYVKAVRYYEYPYFNKRYNKIIMNDDVDLESLTEVNGDPYKVSIFRKVYPQQVSTLKWEKDIQTLPEYYHEAN